MKCINNNNNNNNTNAKCHHGRTIVRVHPVHLMNVVQRRPAAR